MSAGKTEVEPPVRPLWMLPALLPPLPHRQISIATMTAEGAGVVEGEAVENEHSPPSSAEEAAALVGAAISFDALTFLSSPKAAGHPNPPQGMHSVFTVQTPVPNQVLFVRLVNLRAWLRWHANALEDSPGLDGLDDSVSAAIARVICRLRDFYGAHNFSLNSPVFNNP